MFSDGSSSEISFATVTPSCVTVGTPNFLSRDTLRPLGPRVTFTASASVSIPFFKERRASSVKTICLAITSTPCILFFTVQNCSAGVPGDCIPRPEREERCPGDSVEEPSLPFLFPRLPPQAAQEKYLRGYHSTKYTARLLCCQVFMLSHQLFI